MSDEFSGKVKYRNCNYHRSSGIVNRKPSLTEQEHKESCDINNVVKSYTLRGYTNEDFMLLSKKVFSDARRFVDCTNIPDLGTAEMMMRESREAFIQNIPSHIREKFNNNSMDFYKFVADPKNKSEVEAMLNDLRNYNVPSVDDIVHPVSPSANLSTKQGDGE